MDTSQNIRTPTVHLTYSLLSDHYLIRNYLSLCFFFSQILTLKLNLQPNTCLTYANSVVKCFFFVSKEMLFFISLLIF